LTAEIREFITNPWIPNHVLALRVAGGASAGDRLRYGSFRLGGSFGESGFYVLPDEYRPLRGFPISSASGNWYYLGSAEYRAPLWRIDRGTGTVPAFFKTRRVETDSHTGLGHRLAGPTRVRFQRARRDRIRPNR
jgi:hypothetical protein